MRKWFVCGFLVLALSLAMSTAALAADGIQSAASVAGNNVTLAVDQNNPDKLNVTYSGASAGSEYVVFATSGGASEAPTESNLVYIDQKTAGSGGVSFVVYPKTLTNGTYQVWMSSNAATGVGARNAQNIGTFVYYTEKPAYTLGDVNSDGRINSTDAILVLRYAVGNVELTEAQKLAAEVNGITGINSGDAILILQRAVDDTVKFPAEGN